VLGGMVCIFCRHREIAKWPMRHFQASRYCIGDFVSGFVFSAGVVKLQNSQCVVFKVHDTVFGLVLVYV
jgi:hypothetical protein